MDMDFYNYEKLNKLNRLHELEFEQSDIDIRCVVYHIDRETIFVTDSVIILTGRCNASCILSEDDLARKLDNANKIFGNMYATDIETGKFFNYIMLDIFKSDEFVVWECPLTNTVTCLEYDPFI